MTASHHGTATNDPIARETRVDPIARETRVAAMAWDLVSRFRVSYISLLGRRNPLSSPAAA